MDRRTARTRRNIRKALLDLMERKPLQKISVTELSELADINRKTFYLHYNTVSDVITEIETEVAADVAELLAQMPELSVTDLFRGLNALMEENITFYRQISRDPSVSFLKFTCKDILKSALYDAFFDPSPLSGPEFMVYAEYVASGIIGVYTAWLADDDGLTLDELTDLASDALMNAWERISSNQRA